MAEEAPSERTKYKAALRYITADIAKSFGKEPPSEENINAMAAILKSTKLTPTRNDRRFPNVNQANNCWTAFNEYQLCVEKRGRTDRLCLQRGRDYSTICPHKWVEEFKDAEERGVPMSVGHAFVLDKE